MIGYCYMLRCADGSFYVGSTIDLEARVHRHQIGEGAAYTSRRRPVELVWFEKFDRISDAFAREKQIQNWGRAKRIALIEQRYADLPAPSQNYVDRFGTESS
ncbi:GIY-YIG nuclease family protein [Nocardioides antri]|uniref:GIY-YIG nuclease family protein n=2 Tax=Nocardioides antri TaxID=2607659 RepID=A0A5B1M0X4_9ACTN|nr:GIY-YIG nuclease family protein [Nocardioides antri]